MVFLITKLITELEIRNTIAIVIGGNQKWIPWLPSW